MPNPKLPPILINKAGSVYYVYTYKNVWDRELKRSKRGESKKIGTILGGRKEGKIRFDEAFLQEHPEFRNYQVERKGKDYVFTQISEEGITLEQARNIKKLYAGATWASHPDFGGVLLVADGEDHEHQQERADHLAEEVARFVHDGGHRAEDT